MPKTIGIVGYGKFGALLAELSERFLPDTQIRIYSSKKEPDQVRFFSLAETARSEWLILSVPISAFRDTLIKILPLVSPATIIVDVATVKLHTLHALKELVRDHRYVAMHPMFGPESFKKRGGEVAGMRVVICEHTLPIDLYYVMQNALANVGFDVVTMTASEHDRHLARTLFLTHFVGQIVARAKFDRTEIDTVSFGFLMDAVESVKHDEALFRDVFRFNPYCREVLTDFADAQKGVEALLDESQTVQ